MPQQEYAADAGVDVVAAVAVAISCFYIIMDGRISVWLCTSR